MIRSVFYVSGPTGGSRSHDRYCQEIGLVAFMFFFELLFSYVSSSISFYVFLTNLFSIIPFLIC